MKYPEYIKLNGKIYKAVPEDAVIKEDDRCGITEVFAVKEPKQVVNCKNTNKQIGTTSDIIKSLITRVDDSIVVPGRDVEKIKRQINTLVELSNLLQFSVLKKDEQLVDDVSMIVGSSISNYNASLMKSSFVLNQRIASKNEINLTLTFTAVGQADDSILIPLLNRILESADDDLMSVASDYVLKIGQYCMTLSLMAEFSSLCNYTGGDTVKSIWLYNHIPDNRKPFIDTIISKLGIIDRYRKSTIFLAHAETLVTTAFDALGIMTENDRWWNWDYTFDRNLLLYVCRIMMIVCKLKTTNVDAFITTVRRTALVSFSTEIEREPLVSATLFDMYDAIYRLANVVVEIDAEIGS